jgi:hypothetical protein
MASIEHEAKGSLEISALRSARLLLNEKNKKKVKYVLEASENTSLQYS